MLGQMIEIGDNRHVATPFVKWAGGKARLVPLLAGRLAVPFARYHEPFIGGGAVFFGLEERGRVRCGELSDLNDWLIAAYTVVRDDVDALIDALRPLQEQYRAAGRMERAQLYYDVRAKQPAGPVERAAWLLFLNKTCYNGLFRVNRRGSFNVPHGRYANPSIVDETNLRACAKALANVELCVRDFEASCDAAAPGDLVYLDPPYQPLSATAKFTHYTQAEFGEPEQARLAAAFRRLTERGVAAVVSNSAHPLIADLYAGFEIERVPMSRAINSVGSARGPVDEFLITNFVRAGYGHAAK